jgi:hypothetical protein
VNFEPIKIDHIFDWFTQMLRKISCVSHLNKRSPISLAFKQYSSKTHDTSAATYKTIGEESVEVPQLHFPSVLSKAPPTKVTVLDNGFRIITEKRQGETACVGVFIGAGSRHETKENNGVAHFLEHMYFKVLHFSSF